MTSSPPAIIPIDQMIYSGFQDRFQQVFNCKCAFINSNDKTKILDRVFGRGHTLEYPYAYFEIQNISSNKESYNPHQWVRKGLVVNVNSNSTIQRVRIIPANLDIEISYVTNAFESVEQGSVLAFVRRWLLAARAGYLKFTVNYGLQQFGIALTLSDSIAIPSRDNITESETSYKLTATATIHGYISEPILAIQGKTNTINVQSTISGVSQNIAGSQFLKFNRDNGS